MTNDRVSFNSTLWSVGLGQLLRGLQLDYVSTADIPLKSYLVGNVTEHIQNKNDDGDQMVHFVCLYPSPEKKVVETPVLEHITK